MKYMKKCLVLIFCLMVILPTCVFAAKKNKNLVNVYVFEAGGCGYCAQQIEYLKSLPSYNKKFKIVVKELYESTATWNQGKDYALGKKVVDLFYNQGFTDAAYTATPFVVISDLYAATGYYANLEDIIEQAYKDGDKDVVKCVESGKDGCLAKDAKPAVEPSPASTTPTTTEPKSDSEKSNNGFIVLIILAIGLVLIFVSRKNNVDDEDIDDEEDDEDDNEEESVEEDKTEEVKEEAKDTKKSEEAKEVKKKTTTSNKKKTKEK